MKIEKFTPSPPLQPYIHQYYLVEGDFGKSTSDVFFADGCIEVVFNIDIDFYRVDKKEHWAKVIGQITDPLKITATGQGKSFGIWFTPQGFSMFSDISAKELTNQSIPLDSVFDHDFINFVGSCLSENTIPMLISGIDQYLKKLIKRPINETKSQIAAYAVRYLHQSKEVTNLDALVKSCGVSHRYLQKIFLERVGISPKQFQRISRFQRALGQLTNSTQTNLTEVTYVAGYYDQSHFIREFKGFTGFRPSAYQLQNHPINQYFLNS